MEIDKHIDKEKKKWGFYNIGMSMVPVGLFALLTKNPMDLWSGTFSCVCALAASVFCTIVDEERNSNKETCLILYGISFISIILLAALNIASVFEKIHTVEFTIVYLLAFLIMFYPIYKIFSQAAERKIRQRISVDNQKNQVETKKEISNIANEANNINIE